MFVTMRDVSTLIHVGRYSVHELNINISIPHYSAYVRTYGRECFNAFYLIHLFI